MTLDVLLPHYRKLYLCRFGGNGGKQVALFLGYRGDCYVVRKWLAKSGRWTNQLMIAKPDILARATAEDCRKYAVDVSKLAPAGQRPKRMKTEIIVDQTR